jgi:hypothetical protein
MMNNQFRNGQHHTTDPIGGQRFFILKFIEKGSEEEEESDQQGYGVHVATVAGGILLRHTTYIYQHGKYPFVWRTCYPRENSKFTRAIIIQLLVDIAFLFHWKI